MLCTMVCQETGEESYEVEDEAIVDGRTKAEEFFEVVPSCRVFRLCIINWDRMRSTIYEYEPDGEGISCTIY